MIDIPKRIKELSEKRGLSSINELSRLADIPQSTLATIMLGKTSPRADTLERIASALNVTMAEFFADDFVSGIINHAEKMNLTAKQLAALEAYKKMPLTEQQTRLTRVWDKLKGLPAADQEALLRIIDSLASVHR
ncbi:MAG: helix-turn-helix domain protein [Firmicutes bacterium]|nr:helix-turn-helix domain protein [Bacillota bacterium]